MEGHQVPSKIWTYTLSHYIKLRGMVPHGELELSPDELVYRNRPNDGSLKIEIVVGFISDLQVRVGKIWTTTSKM